MDSFRSSHRRTHPPDHRRDIADFRQALGGQPIAKAAVSCDVHAQELAGLRPQEISDERLGIACGTGDDRADGLTQAKRTAHGEALHGSVAFDHGGDADPVKFRDQLRPLSAECVWSMRRIAGMSSGRAARTRLSLPDRGVWAASMSYGGNWVMTR